jgi:Rab-like protein 2
MHSSYYHRAHAAILVFDITRKATYQHLDQWYAELQGHRPGLPCVVVANKVDEDEGVTGKVFAFVKKREACVGPVRFVSAADGRNVVKVVKEAVRIADEYRRRGNEADFSGEVMDALDYFDKKEKANKGKPQEEEKSNADNTY